MRASRAIRYQLRAPLVTSGAALAAIVMLAVGPAQAGGAARTSAADAAATTAARSEAAAGPLTTNTNAACNAPQRSGFARCLAVVRTASNHAITAAASPDLPPATALGPADIQSAYKLPASGGGQTVAIVDALGDSRAESDLAAFRSYYGLPACTTGNGCFRKVDQAGGTSYPGDDPGWALETSLDLDAVSSACPACNILLVEGNDASIASLGAAADEAVALGAKYVSNSYGAAEDSSELSADSYYDHPGVAVTASSGDAGNVVNWPSTDPNVVAVGGTTLTADTAVARGWDEKAWGTSAGGQGGGSGCSAIQPHPDYQNGIATGCAMRATADISADADPASGLATYDTLGQNGWLQVGGTSLASPLLASMYALAGTPVAGIYPVTYPYHDPSPAQDLFDVTSGSNGSCGTVLCNAGPGWDGPTGLGTPDGVKGLAGGAQGEIAGQVTDAVTGRALVGVAVMASPGNYATRTDSSGDYALNVGVGSYTITAASYAYKTTTQAGVQASANQTTTVNLALDELTHGTISGTVTDGSGHGWPLYARITIDGYPGGPVYTDPVTGRYSVLLAGPASYTVHVTAAYPAVTQSSGAGYQELSAQLDVGGGDLNRNFALTADASACTAPGYARDGLAEEFTGWAGATARDGWAIGGRGWRFDNPGNRPPPSLTAGDDAFAIADSSGSRGRMETTLTSPPVNLTGQASPRLTFATAYYAVARGQSASVDLSADGGKTWATIWHQASSDVIGQVDIPIPRAAGRAAVRVRFDFSGSGGWWWAVDDILVGTHDCVPVPGGMLVGLVTDQATGQPVNGALVTSAGAGASGISAGTGDPGVPGGFYWLFTPKAGSQSFTAAAPGYSSSAATVNIGAGQVTRHDWALTEGEAP